MRLNSKNGEGKEVNMGNYTGRDCAYTAGFSRQEIGCEGQIPNGRALSQRVRALVGVMLSQEGEIGPFWKHHGRASALGEAIILDLSLAGSKVSALEEIPPASVDLLVCDSSYLGRVRPELLASHARQGTHQVDTGADHATLAPALALQRQHIQQVFAQFSRIVKGNGVCVLAYQHMLASAWLALGEALAVSRWRCCTVIPWPMQVPVRWHLYPRLLAWDALLVCQQRGDYPRSAQEHGCSEKHAAPGLSGLLDDDAYGAGDAGSSCADGAWSLEVQGVQIVVDSSAPERATEQMSKYLRSQATRRGRRPQMRLADQVNLWRALVVSEASVGKLTPQRILLADALKLAYDPGAL